MFTKFYRGSIDVLATISYKNDDLMPFSVVWRRGTFLIAVKNC